MTCNPLTAVYMGHHAKANQQQQTTPVEVHFPAATHPHSHLNLCSGTPLDHRTQVGDGAVFRAASSDWVIQMERVYPVIFCVCPLTPLIKETAVDSFALFHSSNLQFYHYLSSFARTHWTLMPLNGSNNHLNHSFTDSLGKLNSTNCTNFSSNSTSHLFYQN